MKFETSYELERFISADCEPRGEACEGISNEWLSDKFCRMTSPLISQSGQKKIINLILGDESRKVRELVDLINGEIRSV